MAIADPNYIFTLSPSGAFSLEVGGSQAITATLTSEGATSDVTEDCAWSSSDESAATVSGGVVSGVGAGTAVITATYSNASTSVTVTVTGGLSISPSSARIPVGGAVRMSAYYTASDGTATNVTEGCVWPDDVEVIGDYVVVYGAAAGDVEVTASYDDPDGDFLESTATVTVVEDRRFMDTEAMEDYTTMLADCIREALDARLAAKQDALTIDTAADATSSNPVTNGAITSYVQGLFSYDADTETLTITTE